MQQSKHTAVRVGPFEICMACHLLWPCMDGKILEWPHERGQTVNEVRRLLTS